MKLYYYLENDGAGAGYAMFCELQKLWKIFLSRGQEWVGAIVQSTLLRYTEII